MTTHLRARALQAGAFLALIGGVLFAAPSAALAADPTVTVSNPSPASIPSGGKTTIEYSITNPNAEPNVDVQVSASGMSCGPECKFTTSIPVAAGAKSFSAILQHTGTVAAGETKTIQIQVSAKVAGSTETVSRSVTVRGADKPQAVRGVSGRVKDQDGKAVSGARVGLRDSTGRVFETDTNGSGNYSFTSTDSKPIAVGTMAVGANKEGYELATVTAQGVAGKSINVPLTIKSKASPSPSTSPTPSPTVTTEPTNEVTDEETAPAADESAAIDAAPTSGEDGSGSMLFIILGGLLVAAGIGAIVLVLMRRKANDDAEEQDGATPAGGAVPAPAGRYGGADETRLAAPAGGRVNDATMIAPRSGAPSMADAPTMIHQAAPPVDEFPDPYGAPMPQGGGYNAPGGWGTAGVAGAAGAAGAYGAAQAAPAYGTATQYGGAPAPAQHGGYADQDDHGYAGNGYGPAQPDGYHQPDAYDQPGYDPQAGYEQPQQRYDEPTGMYRPEPAAGYPQEAGYDDQAGYGGADPAYGQNAGYPQGGADYADPGHAAPYQGGNGYQGGAAYGAPAEQPADPNGYGGWGGAGGDIDSGNAYGPPAGGGTYGGAPGGGTYSTQGGAQPYGGAAGTYGAPAGGGYAESAGGNGYGGDPAGYDPRATYGRPEGYDQPGAGQGQQPPQGGYGDQTGYYGGPEQGGRHGGQQPPDGTRPGQRRPNDWVED